MTDKVSGGGGGVLCYEKLWRYIYVLWGFRIVDACEAQQMYNSCSCRFYNKMGDDDDA